VEVGSPLTQLLQGGDAELVVVVVRERRGALPHGVGGDGVGGDLHRLHAADQRLEPLVGERGLAAVQLYDPGAEEGEGEAKRSALEVVTFYSCIIMFRHFERFFINLY